MKTILIAVVLANTLCLFNCCFQSVLNKDCSKAIGSYSVRTSSPPEISFNFNDASGESIDGRLTLRKTSGKLGFYIIDTLTNIRSGFTVEWKGDEDYELEAGSQWSIKCFVVNGDTTSITVNIPVCDPAFPRVSPLQIKVTIDEFLLPSDDSESFANVVTGAVCN
jgi:hypothetical protein